MIHPKAEESDPAQRRRSYALDKSPIVYTAKDHDDVKMCVQSTWYNTWDVDALVDEFGFDGHRT